MDLKIKVGLMLSSNVHNFGTRVEKLDAVLVTAFLDSSKVWSLFVGMMYFVVSMSSELVVMGDEIVVVKNSEFAGLRVEESESDFESVVVLSPGIVYSVVTDCVTSKDSLEVCVMVSVLVSFEALDKSC